MKITNRFIKVTSLYLTLVMSITISQHALANSNTIKFITAPTHSKAITREIYTPLINYLSKTTGKKIELVYPINFLDYSMKMRKGQFDIAFDGPHFVSWRVKKFNDVPVARLEGEINIVVVIPKTETKFNTLSQLAGHKVCAFPSPNLLTMGFLNHFQNPMRQPILTYAKGFKGLQRCLESKKGKAMVLRKEFWNKMNQSAYKILDTQNISYPERTLTIASRIDSNTRNAITNATLNPAATPYLQKLLGTFRKKALTSASANEYNEIYKILAPVWGFNIR